MNKHDSEWIAGVLADTHEVTVRHSEADFLVINTCAVRDKAEQKFTSLLGRLRPLKTSKRGMVIGVAGCVAQEHGEALAKREPIVDMVFGSRTIARVPEMLARFEQTGQTQVNISDNGGFDDYPMVRESSVSAWVSIMQGCDNFCSYCIVPLVRGRERSRPAESIISEVCRLASEGYVEITLLGQNVNSYGRGLAEKTDFPSLLARVSAVEGIKRIRFITSHPKDLSDRLIDTMASLENVCPSLHLPLQSGSDPILKQMNRGYSADEYFRMVDRLRDRIPGISLTSDIIVGFPGETDADFQMTIKALERLRFYNIFLFKYSPRSGTAAAALDGEVGLKITSDRFLEAMDTQEAISRRWYESWVGKQVEV
ncbi:MAG: tRNA (N6-isopentenyl adenosine(37)-C2)-methylthiotransferase MiaB, partial [Nitrospinota bacterium]|nr:tRNA (N6-isopentenyl adenosine(37)-C2)-methylthiotransferase MiaB [Nitrospinota bacterium]